MKTASDPRHRHRAKVLQHLFSANYQGHPDPIVGNIWNKLSQLDPIIVEIAPEWPIDKLNPVDLAILRQAIYELTVDKQAPYKVIIDEAVELAKEFGSSGSPAFVNGALGKLIKNLGL